MQTLQVPPNCPITSVFGEIHAKLAELNELIANFSSNIPDYSSVYEYFAATNPAAFELLYDPETDLKADVEDLMVKATEEGIMVMLDNRRLAYSKFPVALLRRHFE